MHQGQGGGGGGCKKGLNFIKTALHSANKLDDLKENRFEHEERDGKMVSFRLVRFAFSVLPRHIQTTDKMGKRARRKVEREGIRLTLGSSEPAASPPSATG